MTLSIERIAPLRTRFSCPEIAAMEGVKPDYIRRVFCKHGIKDPHGEQRGKNRRLALKFRGWGWTHREIAEQLEMSPDAVRMMLRRMRGKRWVQLSLWPEDAFRVQPKPSKGSQVMRVVHRQDPNQLSLFEGDAFGPGFPLQSFAEYGSGISASIRIARVA